uniref:Uncharacterized protein n=1 Tax=Anguilla anguilla TaxID=7936 RepID=A0A0E9QVR7_ANGAN
MSTVDSVCKGTGDPGETPAVRASTQPKIILLSSLRVLNKGEM